mgnify:CR=1 FL=1
MKNYFGNNLYIKIINPATSFCPDGLSPSFIQDRCHVTYDGSVPAMARLCIDYDRDSTQMGKNSVGGVTIEDIARQRCSSEDQNTIDLA